MEWQKMIDDLRHLPQRDAFQIIDDSIAFAALLCLAFGLLAFWGAYG